MRGWRNKWYQVKFWIWKEIKKCGLKIFSLKFYQFSRIDLKFRLETVLDCRVPQITDTLQIPSIRYLLSGRVEFFIMLLYFIKIFIKTNHLFLYWQASAQYFANLHDITRPSIAKRRRRHERTEEQRCSENQFAKLRRDIYDIISWRGWWFVPAEYLTTISTENVNFLRNDRSR